MSYIINNSRGQVVAVVADGTINTSATSLSLVGRAVSNYGESENENYVFLMENFADSVAPLQPLQGQLWYNTATDVISVYTTANAWAELASQSYVQAQKISPVFSGAPTAPTASPGTANTQIATTAFVTTSPQFAGVPTAPTAPTATANTQIATTAFVQAQKASPVFTGAPTAPTPVLGTANTQIATAQFVIDTVSGPGSILGSMAQQNANSVQISGGTINGISPLSISFGGTGASTAANARINLGLGTMATQNSGDVSITGGSISGLLSPIPISSGGTGGITAAAARLNLGLGTISTQNASNVTISGGTIFGIAPLPVDSGGTGAALPATARDNLGLKNMSLQESSNVTVTGGNITGVRISLLPQAIAVIDGGTGATNTVQARTNLGLGSMATQNSSGVEITGGNISGISPLPVSSGGTGASNATSARTNLGLGTMALQNSANVIITGGNISGITPLAVTAGGTGASDAAQARQNLGIQGVIDALGNMSQQNANSVNITGGAISGITPLPIASGGTGTNTAEGARDAFEAASRLITITGTGGLTGGGNLTQSRTISIASDSNGFGRRFVQSTAPVSSNNGDIWYQI